jgi:hypothetical protein
VNAPLRVGTLCSGCGVPMVPYGRQSPPGWWVHHGHGLCRRCYPFTSHRCAVVDAVAVARAVAGDPPARLTPRERRAAVAELTRRGLSAPQIAARVHVTVRAVERNRAALRRAS